MPAYFSINIGIKKSDIYDGIYSEFIGLLLRKGMRFTGGYLEFMDEPPEDIITWNEIKLREASSIGHDEHLSGNYRQACFDYLGFSEVRMYILNLDEEDEVDFIIIIPEDELIRLKDTGFSYKPEIMANIKELIVSIWEFGAVSAIQTSLELSGDAASIRELEGGARPMIIPYAIIPVKYMKTEYGEAVTVNYIDGDGVLLTEYPE